MNITTRRAVIAAPVTLPLLPAPAVEAEADEGEGLAEFMDSFQKLSPKVQEAFVVFICSIGKLRSGVAS